MLKIGTIYTLYGRRAGAELYFEKILKGMIETSSDIEVLIYCNNEAYNALPENLRIIKNKISWLNNQFSKAFWLEFLAASFAEKAKLDLFWIPSGCNSFPGRWRIPNVVTFLDFGEYHVKSKYDFKRMVYRKHFCVLRSIRRAKTITTISHFTANDMVRLFRVGVPIRVIYPGPSPLNNADPDANHLSVIRQETGIELSRFIFTPGRTDYIGKGLDVLLDAYGSWSQKVSDIPDLVLVGPQGEDHEAFVNHISQLGLGTRIKYFGRVSDRCVAALYTLCEFVVIPSRFEGFGFPVLEAMRFGKPMICSDAGSLPEVAAGAALLFRTGDASNLLAMMTEMHCNAALRVRLMGAGAKRCTEFDWNTTYDQMYNVFLEATGNRKKQGAP